MKFKIVWIDDSRSWVRSVEPEINEQFERYGFLPDIDKFQKTEPAREKILGGYADLILVDHTLPQQTTGDLFIKQLRADRCFAHVIFYSQAAENLQVMEEDKHFISVTHRDDIVSTVNDVARHTFREYKHPAFMRGLLLSEFIDLENIMDDLIVQSFKMEGEYFRKTVIHLGGESYSLASKQKFINRQIKDVKKLERSLADRLNEINFTASGFVEAILKRRNVLAHAYPKYDAQTGQITLVSAISNIDFSNEWFHETREGIHEHKSKLRALMSLELFKVTNP